MAYLGVIQARKLCQIYGHVLSAHVSDPIVSRRANDGACGAIRDTKRLGQKRAQVRPIQDWTDTRVKIVGHDILFSGSQLSQRDDTDSGQSGDGP